MLMKRKLNKKGQLLGQLGLTFQQLTFIGIFGAIMLVILTELNSTISDTDATNAIQNVTLGIGNVFKQFPLFGTILGLLLIVGVVFLLVRGSGRGSVV
jgi:hypothetical protein